MAAKSVTDASFQDDVLNASGPVLVDFWAEWCTKCRALAPTLEQISDELRGRLTVAKLDIDDNPEVPTRFGVRGIPTMILFKNGAPAATKVGVEPKSALMSWLESQLS
jgi:thioredoxin 1